MVDRHVSEKVVPTLNFEYGSRQSHHKNIPEEIHPCIFRTDDQIGKDIETIPHIMGSSIQDNNESRTNRNTHRNPDLILSKDCSSHESNPRMGSYYDDSDGSSARDSRHHKDAKRRKQKRKFDYIDDGSQSHDSRDRRKEKKHKHGDRRKKKHKKYDRKEREHSRRKKKHKKEYRKERKHKRDDRKDRKHRQSVKDRYESIDYDSFSGDDSRGVMLREKMKHKTGSSCGNFSTSSSSSRFNLKSNERQITPMSPSGMTKRNRKDFRSPSNDLTCSNSSFSKGTNDKYIETDWETVASQLQSKISRGVSEGSFSGSTPASSGSIQKITMKDNCSTEHKFENNIFIPVEMKSITILGNESYIKDFMNEYANMSDDNRMNQSFNISSVVQGIYKVLLDVTAFQFISSDSIFEVQPMPSHVKPVQTVSSVQDFIILQAFTQNWEDISYCRFMEEVALAFRLAAHCILKSSESTYITKKVNEAKKRGLVTLFRCLRGCYSLMQEKIHEIEAGYPVKDNIQNFFLVPSKCSFSKAQILLLDIVPLLSDGADTIGVMGKKGSKAVLENLLNLDSVSVKRKMKAKGLPSLWSFNDGLIEFFIRQLLHQENDESLRMMIKNISITRSESVAFACASEDISPQCYDVICNVRKTRQVQLERIVLISDQDLNDEITNAVLDGCSYLSEIITIMRHYPENSDRRLALFLSEVQQNDMIAHLAFHCFHMLMTHDIIAEEEYLHAKSVYRPENLSSAVLASLLLSSKNLECPISMKNLIKFSCMVGQDKSTNSSTNPSLSKPMEELIKTYELHIQSMFGFDLPLASELPYSFINEVLETFCLDQSKRVVLIRCFLDVGVTHSSVSLLDQPKLVALATCYYASNYLRTFDLSPAWKSNITEKEKHAIISIAGYMKQVSLFFENKKKTIDILVPVKKPCIRRLVYFLNNQM